MEKQVLGFIGIGKMGEPMAGRLLDAGYQLSIFDARPEAMQSLSSRGARTASSAAEVASEAGIVFLSLPNPGIVKHAVLEPNGLADGRGVQIVIDLSTTGPGTAKIIADALDARDIAWVDAPVSGGVKGAREGTLSVMVSCRKAVYEQVTPLLQIFGKLFYTGEKPGLAQSAKLANNLMAAAALVITSEAVAMGVKSGLDAKVLIDIINASSGRNSASQDKFPRSVLPGTFDFGFTTGLSYKDVRLCVEEAEALGVPMICGAAVMQMLAITTARFGADSDFTAIAKVLEEWSGIEMRS
jgi:3-hydroxyisobutyrate dehydrogenase-like beta-hydroxyacid dehydrogenase